MRAFGARRAIGNALSGGYRASCAPIRMMVGAVRFGSTAPRPAARVRMVRVVVVAALRSNEVNAATPFASEDTGASAVGRMLPALINLDDAEC